MREDIKDAIKMSVEGLIDVGADISFTNKELNSLGIKIKNIKMSPKKIKKIRNETHFSQSVFAKILNVSISSVRQWEQGSREPTGSTKVLFDLLTKNPHLLDYRINNKINVHS